MCSLPNILEHIATGLSKVHALSCLSSLSAFYLTHFDMERVNLLFCDLSVNHHGDWSLSHKRMLRGKILQ